MGMLAWIMMGLAIWHFTIFLPDRFWGGIVGAFLGALFGAILFGLIVSFSPCLPLVAMLGYIAMISDHWLKGILYMTAFGLGTVVSPMVVAAMLAGWVAKTLKSREGLFKALQIVCGLVICALGLQLIIAASRT